MAHNPTVYADLKGRTVVVTGAARGIGEELTFGLVRNGANVVAADLDEEAVGATGERLARHCCHGARIVTVRADAAVLEDHQALGALAMAEFGQLYGWVNNAGILQFNPLRSISEAEYTRMFRVHALGAMFGGQVAAPLMQDAGGAIVNIASTTAYTVRTEMSAYSSTKAAVEHLTKFQAAEYGPQGVRVNGVAPGMIDTVMSNHITQDEEKFQNVTSAIPLRRFGEPSEVSNVILFLLSDAASFVSGHTIVVDGASRYR